MSSVTAYIVHSCRVAANEVANCVRWTAAAFHRCSQCRSKVFHHLQFYISFNPVIEEKQTNGNKDFWKVWKMSVKCRAVVSTSNKMIVRLFSVWCLPNSVVNPPNTIYWFMITFYQFHGLFWAHQVAPPVTQYCNSVRFLFATSNVRQKFSVPVQQKRFTLHWLQPALHRFCSRNAWWRF